MQQFTIVASYFTDIQIIATGKAPVSLHLYLKLEYIFTSVRCQKTTTVQ